METMTFVRQAGTAVYLVTLSIQCFAIAVLIRWATTASIERGVARLSSLHSAASVNPSISANSGRPYFRSSTNCSSR